MPLPDGRRSDGDADRASNKRFAIGFTIFIAIVTLLCYTPIFHNFFYAWHANAKSWTKHFAFVPFAAALYAVYKAKNASDKSYYLLVLLLIGLGIGISSGLVFDLK